MRSPHDLPVRRMLPVWLHSVGPLALADLRHRYAGSWLGGTWALLGPLVEVAAYAAVFGLLLRPASAEQGLVYALYVAVGLLPWTALREGLETSSVALADNRWIRRSRVPPELLIARQAVASAARGAAGIVLAVVVLLALLGHLSATGVAWALLALVLQTLAVYGLGLALAPAAALHPDLRPGLASGLTLLTFASPILYPRSILSPELAELLALNPYTHYLRLYRSLLPGTPGIGATEILVATLTPILLIGLGRLAMKRLYADARDAL